ncbi:MAG: GldG family protein [Chloroflexi bacterium]|nr:GldG family protein [Chloroflexota bacterium]
MPKALILAVLVILCVTPVSAQSDLLDGKVVLFAVDNGESAPFNHDDSGASKLAGLLIRQGATVGMVNWSLELPPVDLIVLAGPTRDYSGGQVARLWQYVNNGGSLLVLANPPDFSGRALRQDAGLFELLWQDFGLRMNDEVLINPPDGVLPSPPAEVPTTENEGTPQPTSTPEPLDPSILMLDGLVALDAAHPLLLNVDPSGMYMHTARPVEVTGSAFTMLGTTELIYAEGNVRELMRNNQYFFDQVVDRGQLNHPVSGAAELNASRVVLVGNAALVANGSGFLTSPPGSDAFVWPDNVRFVMNAIYWLLEVDIPDVLDFPEPAAIGTPTPTPSPTPEVTPTEQT